MNNTWKIRKICDTNKLASGITVDNDRNIYFTTYDENIYHIQKDDNINTKPNILVNINGALLRGIIWNENNNILYICDRKNNRIYSYSINNRNISILAGTGEIGYKDGNIKDAQFYNPSGITMDKNGDLYITDRNHVRKINISSGTVETIASSTTGDGYKDGEAKYAEFDIPIGLTIDNDDTIYVADFSNHCIRSIKNGIVSTIAGIPGKEGNQDGSTNQSMFKYPHALILNDDGNLLVGDNNGLRKIDMNEKKVSTLSQGILHQIIWSLTRDTSGLIYVGCNRSILELENTWKLERFLWIGWMKEDSNYCLLARLPKEIIKEIASHLSMNNNNNLTLLKRENES